MFDPQSFDFSKCGEGPFSVGIFLDHTHVCTQALHDRRCHFGLPCLEACRRTANSCHALYPHCTVHRLCEIQLMGQFRPQQFQFAQSVIAFTALHFPICQWNAQVKSFKKVADVVGFQDATCSQIYFTTVLTIYVLFQLSTKRGFNYCSVPCWGTFLIAGIVGLAQEPKHYISSTMPARPRVCAMLDAGLSRCLIALLFLLSYMSNIASCLS